MSSGSQELVDRFVRFYRNYYRDAISQLAQRYPNEQRSLRIDYGDLYQFDPDLAEDYVAQPGQLREFAEEALRVYDLPAGVTLGLANVRIYNLPETIKLQEIRSRHLSELIQVRGKVESSSRIKSELSEAAFECQRCGTMTYIPQPDSEGQEPHECQGCERQGPFRLNADQSEYVDTQTLRIEQQIQGVGDDSDVETIAVRLHDDLVNRVSLGDPVVIAGILKKIRDSKNQFDATIFDKYLEAVSVTATEDDYHITTTEDDKRRIIELSNQPNIHDHVIDSIAPSVHGLQDEKLAIALQLFGGVPKNLPDGTRIRGDLHLLLVGDPGTARTRLLRSASRVAPRAVYANSSQTTEVGLTAAATPSSGNSDPWELKSGVLVMASGGLACLDDFDAFRAEERRPLHEALETQELSISKASVTETLETKTSVLAAANPKYGKFDQYDSIGKQIDLEPGLISRFDLIFTVTDQPNPSQDDAIAEHILEANRAGEKRTAAEQSKSSTLDEELETSVEDFSPDIEASLLRKYIAYARRNCFPTLTDEAKSAIKQFYVDLRAQAADEDAPTPVSARKLEAVIRLSEASARIRLSDRVEKEDADRVIRIVESCLQDIGVNPETGDFDTDVIETGTAKEPQEVSEQIKQIVEKVDKNSDTAGAPIKNILKLAEKQGYSQTKVENVIENLRRKGDAYAPAEDEFKIV